MRRQQTKARAEGRLFGIGLALAVDPSVSNMGYVATALDPQFRAKPEYLPKSGAIDSATVKIDPLGRVIAILGTTPQGQGHQTIVSQIVADELGIEPRDVTVVMIEHNMDVVLDFAERISVLHFGEIIVEGTRTDVVNDPRTKEVYLGH